MSLSQLLTILRARAGLVLAIASLIGCAVGAWSSDAFGRRATIIGASVLTIASGWYYASFNAASDPAAELVELRDAGNCCGSAGVYNLLQPDAARELGARKADSVLASGADLVISANPGCTLQISAELGSRGKPVATAHTAEVLDASIRGLPLSTVTGAGPR